MNIEELKLCPICVDGSSVKMSLEFLDFEVHEVCLKCGFRRLNGTRNLVSRLRKPSEND